MYLEPRTLSCKYWCMVRSKASKVSFTVVTRWTHPECSFEREHTRVAFSHDGARRLERVHNRKRLEEGLRADGFVPRVVRCWLNAPDYVPLGSFALATSVMKDMWPDAP